ncbi:MAG: flagellar basal body rod protein FlgB, partial [Halarsenatibacteraceae bacterium]
MNRVMQILEQGIDGASRRQSHISNNIANADTPGYKREDIDFKSALRKLAGPERGLSLSRTRNNHLAGNEISNS